MRYKNFLVRFILSFLCLVGLINCFMISGFKVSAESVHSFSNTTETSAVNFTNLVVFVKFKGEDEFVDTPNGTAGISTKQLIDNSYINANYSAKDYFYIVSNGKVNMQNVYLFGEKGGSITLSNTRGFYSEYKETNEEGYTQSEYYSRMLELKQDWASAINNAITNGSSLTDIDNLKHYDFSELDKDNDGYIDCLTIVYKYSDEYSVSWGGCLWNYKDVYTGVEIQNGSKTIVSKNYVQLTANCTSIYSDSEGTSFTNLKSIIHETGHIFGLKDLYRSESVSPVYYMSAMAKAISPVPQFFSAKERESLGWLNANNIKDITANGTYTIYATKSETQSDVIAYKLNIPSINKDLYLEYRKFDSDINKYDTQQKVIYTSDGNKLNQIYLKSGLLCFLVRANTKFPSNLNTTGSNWDMEVLGGTYSTKSDAGLGVNDFLDITDSINVEVLEMSDESLTFQINGIQESHTHNIVHHEAKISTCINSGNIEYWSCTDCGKYFSDAELTTEITYEQTITQIVPHTKVTMYGYDATCTGDGLTDGIKCSVCNQILTPQSTIPKIPHTESDWIVDNVATKESVGHKHTECTMCHTVLKEQEILYVEAEDGSGGSDKTGGSTNETSNALGNEEDTKTSNFTTIEVVTMVGSVGLSVGVVVVFIVIRKKNIKH